MISTEVVGGETGVASPLTSPFRDGVTNPQCPTDAVQFFSSRVMNPRIPGEPGREQKAGHARSMLPSNVKTHGPETALEPDIAPPRHRTSRGKLQINRGDDG